MKASFALIALFIIGLFIVGCTKPATQTQKTSDVSQKSPAPVNTAKAVVASQNIVSDSDLVLDEGMNETSDTDLQQPTQDTG